MKIFKILYILLIILLTLNVFTKNTYAVNQTTSSKISELNEKKYTGIKAAIEKLQKSHPNWKFEIFYTGLDWQKVIKEESKHGNNTIESGQKNYTGDWICEECGETPYSGGKWRCASSLAIAYMMDPRNSLNEESLFQFMELSYNKNINYSKDVIKNMLKGSFLEDNNFDKYTSTILTECKNSNVNPYYIAAKIIQEQGKKGGSTFKMESNDSKADYYYNIFNIRATGTTRADVIRNAYNKAVNEGWDTIEKCLKGGIEFIAKGYISAGQNTAYFEKFDVVGDTLYYHQYAQDVLYAEKHGSKLKTALANVNAIDLEYSFIIPVYENMPSKVCVRPAIVRGATQTSIEETSRSSTETRADSDSSTNEPVIINGNIKINNLKINNNIITGIKEKTVEADFLKNIQIDNTLNMKVENTKNGFITTGTKIIITKKDNNSKISELTCTIYGDINKDGKVSSSDYVLIKNHIMTDKKIASDLLQAADVSKDGKVSSSDYVLIKNHIMKGTELRTQ